MRRFTTRGPEEVGRGRTAERDAGQHHGVVGRLQSESGHVLLIELDRVVGEKRSRCHQHEADPGFADRSHDAERLELRRQCLQPELARRQVSRNTSTEVEHGAVFSPGGTLMSSSSAPGRRPRLSSTRYGATRPVPLSSSTPTTSTSCGCRGLPLCRIRRQRLYSDCDLWQRLREGGRAHAISHFGIDRMRKGVSEMLEGMPATASVAVRSALSTAP